MKVIELPALTFREVPEKRLFVWLLGENVLRNEHTLFFKYTSRPDGSGIAVDWEDVITLDRISDQERIDFLNHLGREFRGDEKVIPIREFRDMRDPAVA
ncbi:MAG: hypothetical protein A2653_01645 [Candidatus Zambryskibacteria bacterium RIFCSPHIGHO2_01_FULL_43_25]|uniref:Uncharacterized protein n=1 Tax=Candidatus Zambryskibacteria bacterium RIFCSPLOWO2_01_FULL_45_21 TaxID=1802761 RepID=A0A1G2U1A0_9BACT|nr:MAG: hypothetical protein A2653_01645 [Candidatus Zambryskibacteria bacterium RIFCSPHIGHO2_01_FULL_43_25]OHB00261.1 MAG: hypothetical protein A3E94_00785 [Candidatus Zambryskibacteria bacterium RIFCSPHIGHO2_12_FULL_44_12b]OHB03263.1 MAG: hypothetical protein A3B14_00615 [Candidatus Zambryskibacteria bacterium RIFCSPLOWO2_01_FULL_45_21]